MEQGLSLNNTQTPQSRCVLFYLDKRCQESKMFLELMCLGLPRFILPDFNYWIKVSLGCSLLCVPRVSPGFSFLCKMGERRSVSDFNCIRMIGGDSWTRPCSSPPLRRLGRGLGPCKVSRLWGLRWRWCAVPPCLEGLEAPSGGFEMIPLVMLHRASCNF